MTTRTTGTRARALGALAAWSALAALAPSGPGLAGDGKARDPVVYLIEGEQNDYLGKHIAVVGDVDGDRVKDFAASLEDALLGRHPGRVDLFSGKDGKVLRSWAGETDRDYLGDGLWALPDMDGDGVLELGAEVASVGLRVLSPTTGNVLYTAPELWKGRGYRSAVILPDMDGDGIGEYLLGNGEWEPIPSLEDAGGIECRSGRTGEGIWRRWGTSFGGWLGAEMVLGGDEDQDGVPDVLCFERVGVRKLIGNIEWQAVLRVLSGRTGRLLRTYEPPLPRLFGFGLTMASLGDRDGDGFPEVAVAAPYYREPSPPEVGPAEIFYGDTGRFRGWVGVFRLPGFQLLFSQTGRDPDLSSRFSFHGDELGRFLAPGGDVDGDGIADLLAGAYRRSGDTWRRSRLYVISGAGGSTLAIHEGYYEGGSGFFRTLSPLDDVDGDGRAEYLTANEYADKIDRGAERYYAGAIRLLRYDPEAPRFIRGDADGDGRVNLADAVLIARTAEVDLCMLFDPLPATLPACPAAYDVDADGCIDYEDARKLAQYLFEDFYFTPAPPFPDCAQFYRLQVDGDHPMRHLDCNDPGSCAED
ncbi:MAG: hypothetical protein HY721_17655 [Planctomycetes bacterium]|nr:hypothetical protein [Planctomycetota bacterium]